MRLKKHFIGKGKNDYVYVKPHGIEPYQFIPILRGVFPGLTFRDPYRRDPTGRRNKIYIAAGVAGTPRVYVRHEDGTVHQPVRLVIGEDTRDSVEAWYRCMREVYNDLELGLPLEELQYHLDCLVAGKKITQWQRTKAGHVLTRIYRDEGSL